MFISIVQHSIGYYNMGTENDESDALPMISDCLLVFMLVILNSNRKIPIAHVRQDKKSNLIIKCLLNVL